MAAIIDFISPNDQPALLGISHPEWLAKARATMTELGYKVHIAANHEDFINRYQQVHYRVVFLEALFASNSLAENFSLGYLQHMLASQRRHAVIFLIGDLFQSMNSFQAFQFSVHAVLHPTHMDSLKPVVQQVVADNDLFLQILRDATVQISTWGK